MLQMLSMSLDEDKLSAPDRWCNERCDRDKWKTHVESAIGRFVAKIDWKSKKRHCGRENDVFTWRSLALIIGERLHWNLTRAEKFSTFANRKDCIQMLSKQLVVATDSNVNERQQQQQRSEIPQIFLHLFYKPSVTWFSPEARQKHSARCDKGKLQWNFPITRNLASRREKIGRSISMLFDFLILLRESLL